MRLVFALLIREWCQLMQLTIKTAEKHFGVGFSGLIPTVSKAQGLPIKSWWPLPFSVSHSYQCWDHGDTSHPRIITKPAGFHILQPEFLRGGGAERKRREKFTVVLAQPL